MRFEVTEMGWDKGLYYTRSQKVNGRVVREYVGSGYVAQLAAQLDALERDRRKLEATDLCLAKAMEAPLDAEMKSLGEMADRVARAALLAAGFHRHKRGE